ncbi:MAG: hypothetical protein LBL45_02050 [Treponema sp.]|jgi:hypothetical protein|nr:hypothetical protein [Treponema sp.]
MFLWGNTDAPLSVERNSLLVLGLFQQYLMSKENRGGYSNFYHNINMLMERRIWRHFVLGLFTSDSDKPLYGGLHTFQTGAGYGYELLRNENLSLILGAGLGVGDFGVEFADGKTWPVIPIPLIRFESGTSSLEAQFEFLKDMALEFTLFPQNKIRLAASLDIDILGYKHIRDLHYEAALWYRLFDKNSKLGDFAGIGVGIKNSADDFDLGEKDKSYEINRHSFYGVCDLSFLRISAGYLFMGREIYDKDMVKNIGSGFFKCSISISV